jgi:predicted nucleic acid-binding protein
MKVLADTSLWVDHLRGTNPALKKLVDSNILVMHPFVIGELACGTMKNRVGILRGLHQLPVSTVAKDAEVLRFIETHKLWGRGMGWVDQHLLASALIANYRISTLDKKLAKAASDLKIQY